MKKIGILGAGITGLSVARFLQDTYEVEILEKNPVCGGIARTRDVDGIAYHTVGGHCFNSKYPEIMDFVFNQVLPRSEWNEIQRLSKIQIAGGEFMYPIEFSIKEIYHHNPELAFQITSDFLSTTDNGHYAHLAEWFTKKFGKTLADLYFIPYNTKIWHMNPYEMDPQWVQDKLPIPDKKSFFEALMAEKKDTMPHARFYYPKSNNQNTFIEALAKGLTIRYNEKIHSIKYQTETKKWIVNHCHQYDILINTTPIDQLPLVIEDAPENVKEAAKMLRYNQISNVLWRTRPTTKTWTYLPEDSTVFHRFIHIGSYFRPSASYSISESIGNHSYDELINDGKDNEFLLEPLAYNQSEHAYVVFDQNYKYAVPHILNYLSHIGIHSIGRFGEWQYYNMDVCMKRSLELAQKIKQS